MKKGIYRKVILGGVSATLIVLAARSMPLHRSLPAPSAPSPQTSSPTIRPSAHPSATARVTTAQPLSKSHPVLPAAVQQVIKKTATIITKDNKTYPLRVYKPLMTPNDPNATQWWTTGTALDSAWGIGAGPRQTTVAVIDTGFALKHEELADRWATNAGEQGPTTNEAPSQLNCTDRGLPLDKSCNLIDDDHDGTVDNESGPTTEEAPSRLNCTDQGLPLDKSCNRIDDDGNGYVDDVTGWDFVDQDNNVQAGKINPSGPDTTHATEVSGVLAADGNNGKGIAGVNWSTKILPLQAIDDDGYGDTLTVANAVEYAADRGADVISLSLGASAEDPYLRQMIQYAIGKGSIVVAASGNDGCDCMSYPAEYPEVVAVGAESSSGGPASFSSYGSSLDVLAPGTNIMTSTWSASNPTSAYVSGVAGTSFATPYISGLLSLARSHQPDATWGELLGTLLAEADHTGLSASSPVSPTLGSGYANAGRLLSRVTTPSSPALRYDFGPLSDTDALGSSRAYQCSGSDFPAAPVYKLTNGTTVRYTMSPLDEAQAAASGWAVTPPWYTCVGLPGDSPATVRSINLLSEMDNGSVKSASAN